ncbi:class I SAM-dependent methyltransferase [Clostridium cochlearium]|uniref:class I SAM-dependent methyltransferase n=1 Tax=Clostridium cochlearium TaxID=1494 RepID=UPI000BBBB22C|nr:class I SAM-dependent methyltransferase [Clostridium cochlearium]
MIEDIKTTNKTSNTWFIYLSIFFTTMSLFTYETLLTRLFSVILSYNLVFIVVSFAILGGGLGGILAYKTVQMKKDVEKVLVASSVLLPMSFVVSISIMYFFPFVPTYILYIPAALFPFILGGIITSIIFMEKSKYSSKLYLMDLFGSAIGSLLIIKLMNSFGFLKSVIVVSILATISTMLISSFYKKRQAVILSSILLMVMGLLFINDSPLDTVEKGFYSYYTSPGTVMGRLKNSGENAEITFSKWDAISKTDVIDIKNNDEKFIVTDGGASAPIVKFNGNLESVESLKNEVNYIAFSFGKNEKSLVIGSGGGKDVLFALLGGSKKVDAVEINPSTIAAVNKFKEFSGDIYNYPGVNLYNQDGRYFIENSKENYDNIYLSMVMTNSVENTMYSLAEYYIFTKEAFHQYFDHLYDDGKLTFMVHDKEDLMKVVNTGIKVLMDRGVKEKDVTDYFVIINDITKDKSEAYKNQISMPLVIFKKIPFTQNEINSILDYSKMQNREAIHYMGNEIQPYKSLKTGKMNYKQLIDHIDFNSKPISDNNPFFYNYSKFIPEEMILIIATIILIYQSVKKKFITGIEHEKASIYFAALGMAFMLVEIPLIQKMVLYFGSSSIAFSLVLFSLLVSGGIGSFISGSKVITKLTLKSPYYILAAGIMIIVNQLGLNSILNLTRNWEITYKFFVVFSSLLPMGLLMGMAFPSGIKKLGSHRSGGNIVPLVYGINGIFSVLGSTLAVVISMKFGFNISIYVGAAIYIMLFFLNPLSIFNN